MPESKTTPEDIQTIRRALEMYRTDTISPDNNPWPEDAEKALAALTRLENQLAKI